MKDDTKPLLVHFLRFGSAHAHSSVISNRQNVFTLAEPASTRAVKKQYKPLYVDYVPGYHSAKKKD